jgi:hypothetical protein
VKLSIHESKICGMAEHEIVNGSGPNGPQARAARRGENSRAVLCGGFFPLTPALFLVSVYRVADARSATDLQSAVSQVCNLRIVRKIPSLGSDRRLADYKSAIPACAEASAGRRQIENLRYGKQILSLWERVNHSRRGEQ